MEADDSNGQYELDEQQTLAQVEKYDWSDIDSKLKQFPENIIQTLPPNKYMQTYHRFLNILSQQEHSQRALKLTEAILIINKSNYYALMLRKSCLNLCGKQLKYGRTIQKQLHFISCLLYIHSKEYHLWTYKKQLILLINQEQGVYANEIRHINNLLSQESKNYHAWDYRYWLVTHCKKVSQQINNSQNLIFNSVSAQVIQQNKQINNSKQKWHDCYSLWSYRFNLIKNYQNQSSNFQIEFQRVWKFIQILPQNECGWNYLQGVIFELQVQKIQKIIEDLLKFKQQINLQTTEYKKRLVLRFWLNIVVTIKDILGQSAQQQLKQLLKVDPVRAKYYTYRLQNAIKIIQQ